MTKLSNQMLDVLYCIANPDADGDPFPHAGTVKALIKRGLVRVGEPDAASPADIILQAMGALVLEVTDAGREVLREHGVSA